ncbi:MAG: hypothetical protein HY661_08380 [Betaproteobacteria bacterium]|nr:hypothetical protein [Betaproteobacteria bacterium]
MATATAQVTKWIHISDTGGDPWVLPIWTSVHQAIERKAVGPIPQELSELGPYLSTRLDFLPEIVRRVGDEAGALLKVVAGCPDKHVFSEAQTAYALPVDRRLVSTLLIDIDSLLFEFYSACELMTAFFEKLHGHSGKQMPEKNAGLSIQTLLTKAGRDTSWFVLLSEHRHFFIHEGAPYIAVDASARPDSYDLLIMKQNLQRFDDPNSFLRLSQLQAIVSGFLGSRGIIQQYLRAIYN